MFLTYICFVRGSFDVVSFITLSASLRVGVSFGSFSSLQHSFIHEGSCFMWPPPKLPKGRLHVLRDPDSLVRPKDPSRGR